MNTNNAPGSTPGASAVGRKLALDPNKSYATTMKRTEDTPISLVKAAPGRPTGEFDPDLARKIAQIEAEERKTKLICPACGAVSTQMRLSCQDCGRYFDGGAEQSALDVRAAALQNTGGLSQEEQEKLALKSYLTRRVLAKCADIVVIASLLACQYLLFFSLAKAFVVIPGMAYLFLSFFFWGMPVVNVLTVIYYQAAFEASQVQASPGKFLLGLYVTDMNNQIVRSEAIIIKTVLNILPLLCFIGVYAYFYNQRLQYGMGLNAATSSVLALVGLSCFITYIAMQMIIGKEGKKRTVLDVMVGLRVLER